MEPLLELRKVSFGYGAMPVLDDINIHLHRGQFAALVGPSGAGKTTLLKLILRTLQPTHGEIYTHGELLRNGHTPRVGYVDRGLKRQRSFSALTIFSTNRFRDWQVATASAWPSAAPSFAAHWPS